MRLLVLPASLAGFVIASMPLDRASLDSALAAPAWAGLRLAYTDREVFDGSPVPAAADLTLVDRANAVLPTDETLPAYAARRRYELEIGGSVPVGGVSVPTDERTRGVVTAAYARASQDSEFTVTSWKVGPGIYVTLDAPTILAIGDALTAYVQRLFDRNRVVDEGIAAGTILTRAAVDAAYAGA